MPEYSSTTITPADSVKVPAMNGGSSGNFQLDALRNFILASKGLANGLASLDANGKLPTSQLPDLADDVLVYGSYALLPSPGTAGKLYITADDNKMYRWDDALATPDYVVLSVDLSDYATEAELTDVKNAITAIDHRVENLEQPKGGYVVENYKDGALTPSGKGNWAIVEGLRGVSRVENNAVKNSTFDGTTNWNWNPTNIDVSVSDGILEMTMKGDEPSVGKTAWGISQAIGKMTAGHIYLICAEVNSPSGAGCDWNNQTINASVTANTWSPIYTVRTAIDHSTPTFYLFPAGLTNGQKMKVRNVHIRDLNVEFGTSDLSFLGATDSAKLATIQTNYPHLLLPSDYGTRIVDAGYTGVRAWGKNLISGFQVGKDWALLDASTRACFRLDNPRYIGKAMVLSATWPSTVSTIRVVRVRDANVRPNSFVYEEPISIEIVGNVTMTQAIVDECKAQLELGTTATAYSHYFESTLSFPSTSLKSAGSVYDSCEPNVEVGGVAKKRITERIGSVDLGTLDWTKYQNRFYATISDAYSSSDNTIDLLCEKYIAKADDSQGYMWLYTGRIYIHDENYANEFVFKTAMDGVVLYYPLATESVTLSDPILDNTLLTESGGRMATVQTGTVVDGSFDMGFINL